MNDLFAAYTKFADTLEALDCGPNVVAVVRRTAETFRPVPPTTSRKDARLRTTINGTVIVPPRKACGITRMG